MGWKETRRQRGVRLGLGEVRNGVRLGLGNVR